MVRKFLLLLLGMTGASVVWAAENVQVAAGFESGQIQPSGGAVDSLFVMAASDPQTRNEIYATGMGGFGPSTTYDIRVVPKWSIGGETILPRQGEYFMWHQVLWDKNYTEWNGNSGKDIPRTDASFGQENFVRFDVEYWLGFSIYTPLNFEHETGSTGHRGGAMLLTAYTVGKHSETVFNFAIQPKSESPSDHWYLNYYANPNSVEETGINRVDIGSNEEDIGRWTDFVIRYRANPFSVDTNPAKEGIPDAADKLFRANKGILQVWKSIGTTVDANGNRPMRLVFNIENAPVGNVPSKEDQIRQSFRIYKFAWREIPTTVKGPVWLGFDEIRFGSTVSDGTGFSDVHPTGMDCTGECSNGMLLQPLPPEVEVRIE